MCLSFKNYIRNKKSVFAFKEVIHSSIDIKNQTAISKNYGYEYKLGMVARRRVTHFDDSLFLYKGLTGECIHAWDSMFQGVNMIVKGTPFVSGFNHEIGFKQVVPVAFILDDVVYYKGVNKKDIIMLFMNNYVIYKYVKLK